MAQVSHKTIKYPEILSNVVGKTTNGASSVVSGKTRFPIASANTFGITTSWYYYNSATGAGYRVSAVTATYVEVTGTPTALATAKAVTFGLPTTVTTGMASFYLRAGTGLYPDDPVIFQTGNVGEGLKVSKVAVATGQLVTLVSAVPAGSPSIGSTTVAIGGFAAIATDIIVFADKPGKTGVATSGSLSFSDSTASYHKFDKATSDSLSMSNSVGNRATFTINITDRVTLSGSVSGRAKYQSANVSDSIFFGDLSRYVQYLNTVDNFTFTEVAFLPLIGFITPLTKVVPPILPETRGQAYLLFRHYAPTYRHVNVFLLSNGKFVQDYPTVENGNANVPYPWITDSPDNQYAFVTYFDGTTQAFTLDPHIKRVFWGGETSMITQDLANQLRQAGYTTLEPAYA